MEVRISKLINRGKNTCLGCDKKNDDLKTQKISVTIRMFFPFRGSYFESRVKIGTEKLVGGKLHPDAKLGPRHSR